MSVSAHLSYIHFTVMHILILKEYLLKVVKSNVFFGQFYEKWMSEKEVAT